MAYIVNYPNLNGSATSGSATYTESSPFSESASTPAPTITAITPNIFSAAGGEVFIITGTNLSTTTGITIAGAACTSVSAGGTSITATTPAYSSSAGTSTGQAIVITTSGGTATSSGTLQNAYYLPSTGLYSYHLSDVGITIATGVSSWLDRVVAHGNNWAQATGTLQPSLTTNWNSTGLPALTFNGSSQGMTMTFGTAIASGLATCYCVVNANAKGSGAAAVPLFLGGDATYDTYCETPVNSTNFYQIGNSVAGYANSTAGDFNAHVLSWCINGSSTFFYVDGTDSASPLTAPSTLARANSLGYYARGTNFYSPSSIAADVIYSGAQSSTDATTTRAILKARYGTP